MVVRVFSRLHPVWCLVFELGAGTTSIAFERASRTPSPLPTWRGFPLLQQLIILYARVVHYLFSAIFHCVVTYSSDGEIAKNDILRGFPSRKSVLVQLLWLCEYEAIEILLFSYSTISFTAKL